MSTSFRGWLGRVALVLAAVATFASPSLAAESAQDKAASNALYGPGVNKLKVAGHEFNVKKAKITRAASGMVITGQLSHHLSLRPDDQVYYTIRKSGGIVTSVDIKIDRGGLAPYASKLASHFIGQPVLSDKIESLVRVLGSKIDGRWESAADLIVATIALRANENPNVRDHRLGSGGTPSRPTLPANENPNVRDHRTR